MMETNVIYNEDCIQGLKRMPDKSVDLILTDPPYGLEFRNNEWDKDVPDWINEALRVAKCVIFTTAPLTIYDYPKPSWILCWYRPASNSRSLLNGGFNHWTPILVYGNVKFQVDSINLHAIQNATYVEHPSPKPIKLFRWLLNNATKEGDIVLDPFMGSGTTALACKQLNRQYIGFEISPEYCKVIKKRLSQETLTNGGKFFSSQP